MKTRIFTLAIAFLLIATSCKKEEVKEADKKPAGKQFFNIEMDVVAQTQDDFTVYYTEDGTNAFDPTKAVWKGVNGGGVAEKVVFDLPEQIIPTNIRLDFGIKPERKEVVLKNLKFGYYDKSFEIKGSDFLNYFIVNDLVDTKIDAANGTITFTKAAKSTVGTYFGPRQELLDQIAKLTK